MTGSPKEVSYLIQGPLGAPCEISLTRPASNFDIVQNSFGQSRTISRIFSVARSSHDCQRCIIEDIADIGLLEEDTNEMRALGYDCAPQNKRISFWDAKGALAGYLIARTDGVKGATGDWYVFESVFRKYNHHHNCVPRPGKYLVKVKDVVHEVKGVMFAQQNKRNKRCAQVAIRALLSRLPRYEGLSYKRINALAREFPGENGEFNPKDGLSAAQIEGVLKHLGVRFCSINYEKVATTRTNEWKQRTDWTGVSEDKKRERVERHWDEELLAVHKEFKYGKMLYDGAESGIGALVGFRTFDGKENARHIIPVFGHTFNKDSWVPDSRKFYFGGIDSALSYVQSDNWTSSFIGHDDNLGSDYCIPRAYLQPSDVMYVVELLAPDVAFSGSQAEVGAYKVLKSLMRQVDCESPWMIRLATAVAEGNVILRAVSVSPEEYFQHLAEESDWEGRKEDPKTIEGFQHLDNPKMFWVVEVSLPQLFPANERKVGEVVIDATDERFANINEADEKDIAGRLCLAVKWIRMLGNYFIPNLLSQADEESLIQFSSAPSKLESHIGVIALLGD